MSTNTDTKLVTFKDDVTYEQMQTDTPIKGKKCVSNDTEMATDTPQKMKANTDIGTAMETDTPDKKPASKPSTRSSLQVAHHSSEETALGHPEGKKPTGKGV